MQRKSLAVVAVVVLFILAAAAAQTLGARPASASSDPFRVAGTGVVLNEAKGASEAARYVVQFNAPPLASYGGGIRGLAATRPDARGEARLNAASDASAAYLSYLEAAQTTFAASMEQALGRPVEVAYFYRHAFNGLAVTLSPDEAARVARLPGVQRVVREFARYLQTDAGPAWIGAPTIWEGSSTGDLDGTRGEGVIIGVIDSGINFDHPSFAEVSPGDGYVHTNPRAPLFYGECAPITGAPFCNDKLIGAYDFVAGVNPDDDDGHGSHTASTSGGNLVDAPVQSPTITVTRQISGVAPRANIIAYKACLTVPTVPPEVGAPPPPVAGSCLLPDLLAAINQATADQVDVINYSIGGGSADPYSDLDAQAFLNARTAGVFVAASAGNDGPGAETVGSPADAPWLLAVAASTHNRSFVNALVGLTGGTTTPPGDIQGKSFTAGYGPAPLVYAGAFDDPLCQDATTVYPDGSIVICDRGVNGRVEKAGNVAAGGAGGYVLANDEANGDSLTADAYPIPGVHIGFDDGVALKAWVASGGTPMGTIAGTTAEEDDSLGDVMASFSSRGPNPSVRDILKPDITGPGVDILAALRTDLLNPSTGPEFGLLSGTSMSSPHAAGSAALIRALHPDWSPAEVQSALMTTSRTDGIRKEDGVRPADPFDRGAGRLDLTQAARAGLVLDETTENFTASDPTTGGDPTTLNLASMADSNCVATCGWTRVVSSTLDTGVTWTASFTATDGMALAVSPESFALAPGATQEISVTADVASVAIGRFVFGEVTLTPSDASVPEAHFPVAVLPTGANGALQLVEIEAMDTQGGEVITLTSPIPVQQLAANLFGLQPGVEETFEAVEQDPTNLEPYDLPPGSTGSGTRFVTITVPAGARILGAEVLETTATDIDLFVGLGETPSLATEKCRSATDGPIESCTLLDPEVGATEATYWVMVQNWLTGGVPDSITLQVYVIPGTDNGNFEVTGPTEPQPANEPFDVTITYNEPELGPGEVWFGLAELSSTSARAPAGGQPANVGALLVKITRPAEPPTSVELSGFDSMMGASTPWLALGFLALALGAMLAVRRRRGPAL